MSGNRNVILANDEFYHVFNRTVASDPAFIQAKDVRRVLDLLNFYRYEQNLRFSFFDRLTNELKEIYLEKLSHQKPLIDIYAYSLMPNHFHLLLKQISEEGIRIFLSNFQNSFARYFNVKNKRFGSLFQRPFKAKHIQTDEELLHLSRYIHLNPVTSYLMEFEKLKESNLTSFSKYLKTNNVNSFINTEFLIKIAGSRYKYEKFVTNQVDFQRKLAKIKHLTFE